MSKFKLTIEYEGTRYSGWQMQKGGKQFRERYSMHAGNCLKVKLLIFSEQDGPMAAYMPQDRLHTLKLKQIWHH